MTASAPSARACAALAALQTAVTVAPRALAIWTAKWPTPPVAPLTSTAWPRSSPHWRRPFSAVSAATGRAAACSKDQPSGMRRSRDAASATRSACVPGWRSMMAVAP